MATKRKVVTRRSVDEWQITCLKKQKEEQNDVRDWAGLRDYLLDNVIKRLPLADCLTFATVCKPWGRVSGRFLGECNRGVPCFVKRGQNEFISRKCHSILGNIKFEMELPEAHGRCIWGSFQDWLFIGRSENFGLYISLFNPFSGENIHLPLAVPEFHLMVVSAVPTDEKCICMLVNFAGIIAICTPGAQRWRLVSLNSTSTPLDALYYRGFFYILYGNGADKIGIINEKNVLGMLDTERDSDTNLLSETLSINLPDYPKSFSARHYLVESRGEIVLVSRFFSINDAKTVKTSAFETYRLDRHKMAWLKLENLEDQILFVGSGCSRSFHSKELGDALASNVYFINEGHNVSSQEWDKRLPHKNDADDWGVFSFRKEDHWPSVFRANPNRWAGVWLTAPIRWCLEQRRRSLVT